MSDPVEGQFNPEEKKNLSYLGSKLQRENTDEEEEQQTILDNLDKARRKKLS